MQNNMWRKGLVLGIIVLFVCNILILNLSEVGYLVKADSDDDIYIISSHFATQEEIDEMKEKWGVYDPNKNYNIIMPDGHGTGESPPTEEEWNEMIGNLKIVDNISFPGGKPQLSSIDHSTSTYFPKVGDQQSQGSCAAWATTYYQNGYYQARDKGWTGASSGNTNQLMSPAWTYNKVNYGHDWGSTFDNNFKVIQTVGCSIESKMLYNPNDHISWGGEAAWRSAPEFRCTNSSFYAINVNNISGIKNALIAGFVSYISINPDIYNGLGLFDDTVTSDEFVLGGGHANTVVGFDDNKIAGGEVGAFKIVNSWGDLWGWMWGGWGYYWMTYDAFIENSGYYARFFEDREDYQPSHIAAWEINPQCDRDADIELGIGTFGQPEVIRYPVWYVHPTIMHSYPEFMCLDVSEFNETNYGVSNFYLEIGVAGENNGTIADFWIEYYNETYIPDHPDKESINSSETPKNTPCVVNASFLLQSVFNSNKNALYIFIKDSIIEADSGDVIEVWPNIYHENLIINKSITLKGNNSNTTIINGGGSGDVVHVSADWVNVSGFTIQNSGSSSYPNRDAGIDMPSNNNTISNNIIQNNDFGIYSPYPMNNKIYYNNFTNNRWATHFYNYGNNNTVSENIFILNNEGSIYFWRGENNLIFNNKVNDNVGSGIILIDSVNNSIYANNITGNSDEGIFLSASSNNTISLNNISENSEDGIYLQYYNDNNTIYRNTISDNWYGMRLWESNNNIVTQNTFSQTNYWAVSLSQSSNNNLLYHNNFINNSNTSWDECSNTWDDGYPSGGNYWDDYTGIDADGDGIGDTPYNISGDNNQDLYPLMNPWNGTKNFYLTNLSNNWNFISLPFNQSVNKTDLIIWYNASEYTWQEAVNNSIILGFIYQWNRTNQNYELVDMLNPGFGCWMYAYHNCELWAQGVGTFETDNYITDLLADWNIVGLPDDESLHKENLTVYYNETEYTWQEAVNNSIILGFIYEWNETNQNYEYTDILHPRKGCWMYAYYNCTLLRPET